MKGDLKMPNWCSTDFVVSGPAEGITRFREAVRGSDDSGESPLDFNRLIPMPSELVGTVADFGTAYEVYYGDVERILEYPWVKRLGIETVERLQEHFDADPKHRAIADQWKGNIEKYGAPSWYEWRREHWGTKWNACDAEVTDNGDGSLHVNFGTAWSFPWPVFEKLVSEFPQLLFEGSANEPNFDFYITFEGRNGAFSCEDDDNSRQAAAAMFEDEDESPEVTA
jgi:Ferredoxin-like domain in Api92-like protein